MNFMIAIDVSRLYTKIDDDDWGMQTKLWGNVKTKPFRGTVFCGIIRFVSESKTMRFGEMFFDQIEGYATSIAVNVFDKHQRKTT